MTPREFAMEAHGAQMYGRRPYGVHLARVAELAAEYFADPEIIAAAWLHDVVEDTTVTAEQIRQRFGERVAALVAALTKPRGSRRSVHAAYYRQILAAGDDAIGLKLLDRIANVEAARADNPKILSMYRLEQPGFEGALRHGSHERLWCRLATLFG